MVILMKNNLLIRYETRKFEAWLNSLESWKFEDDKLFYLVKNGKKIATCYIYNNEDLTDINEYSVLVNQNGKKRLLLKTEKITIRSFKEVDDIHAKKEGEGDLSLKYWKEVHKDFFTKELKEKNLQFSEELLLVLEDFKVIKKL